LYAEGITLTEVAVRVGMSRNGVKNRLLAAGVRIRTEAKVRRGADNGRWTPNPSVNAARIRTQKMYTEAQDCKCGRTDGLHRHHVDRNTANLSAENIEWLCASCHVKRHRAEDREAARGIYSALTHVDEWVARFNDGETVAQIARDYSFSGPTIRRWLIERGVFVPWRPGVFAERRAA